MKNRCDMCGLRDGHQKLVLIRCGKCELAVHKECYGMPSFTLKSFTCWACQAVGRSFEIEERNELGNRRRILQQHRPTKCALCNFSEGIHAMHPLYDREGSSARQIYIDGGLAWAHTLCAFSLTLRSFLFGCSRDGNFDVVGEDDRSEDERSENSELMDETQEGDEFGPKYAPIHHFVYDRLKRSKYQQRALAETKRLKCSICGADDKPEDVLRVCLQCNANDKDEFKEFKGKHPSLANHETCTAALHVGCAQWGGSNPHGVKRVYYFPGDDQREPVLNLFCKLHAEDVDEKLQAQKRLLEERRLTEQQQRRREQLGRPPSPPPPPRNNRDDHLEKTITKDLIATVATIRENLEKRNEVFLQRKTHWRLKLKNLTKAQFKNVWKTAKGNLGGYLIEYGKSAAANRSPNSREGSAQRVAAPSRARANPTYTNHVLESQRQVAQVIANQKHRARTKNGSPKRTKSMNGVGSKRRRKEQGRAAAADSDEGEEFEWEQNDDEAEVQNNDSDENSEKEKSGASSLVSMLCRPSKETRRCECCRIEFLGPQEYKRPPPRKNAFYDFGNWGL